MSTTSRELKSWQLLSRMLSKRLVNYPAKNINISNMVKKYRKKPVIIEAIQWDGKNLSKIDKFMGGIVEIKVTTLIIHTLEGDMEASIGDYIIKSLTESYIFVSLIFSLRLMMK